MKLWLIICLGLLTFGAGIVVGLVREARKIERQQAERRRIERDYGNRPDSVEKNYKAGPA